MCVCVCQQDPNLVQDLTLSSFTPLPSSTHAATDAQCLAMVHVADILSTSAADADTQ